MPADRRNRRSLLALLLVAALILLTLDFREGGQGPITDAQQAVVAAFAPVQDVVAGLVRPVTELFSSIGELGGLRESNAALEEELRALREQQVLLAQLAGENDRLRALVGMQERLDLSTTSARVVAQPPGAFRWSVLIDVGADHGVRENMAVINADGFVGKVVDVAPGHSRVQLVVGPTAGYSVRVEGTGQHGLLSGRGSNPMQLQVIDDPEVEVPAGAQVVTRWFRGTAIPDGLPVGVVAEAAPGQLESAQFAAVQPYVDWRRLDLVMVVLDAPEAPVELPGLPEDEVEESGG